jgi:hypothetical protein
VTSVFWLALAVLFAVFGVFHLRRARTVLPLAPNNAKVKTINGLNLGIADFINSFNEHVVELNRESRTANQITGWAHSAAAAAALLSAFAAC